MTALERQWRLAWRRLGVLSSATLEQDQAFAALRHRVLPRASPRMIRRWCEHLTDAAERGAVCTWGLPWAPVETNRRWIGRRLVFWPAGLPSRPVLGVTSSRLGRDLDRRASWFAALRAAAREAGSQQRTLTAAAGSATWPWTPRAAWWFGADSLTLHVSPRESWTAWRAALARQPVSSREAWVSPCLAPATSSGLVGRPLRDRLLLGLCPQVLVLDERGGGTIASLVQQRLRDAIWPRCSLQRAVAAAPPFSSWPNVAPESESPVGDLQLSEPFLWHWTRARTGPWPEQSEEAFIDQLLWNGCGAPRGALAVLRRILCQRRLAAQSGAYRGGGAAVSFTATSLDEWKSQRAYRRHRGRWDFVPYGIGLRRRMAGTVRGPACCLRRRRGLASSAGRAASFLSTGSLGTRQVAVGLDNRTRMARARRCGFLGGRPGGLRGVRKNADGSRFAATSVFLAGRLDGRG